MIFCFSPSFPASAVRWLSGILRIVRENRTALKISRFIDMEFHGAVNTLPSIKLKNPSPISPLMLVCPLDFRYGKEEMKRIFSEENKLKTLMDVEAALAAAHAKVGNIPAEVVPLIRAAADTGTVTVERVKEIEAEIRHDLMAVVKAMSEQCREGGKYIHVGATSYDIIDTARALQIKAAIKILRKDLMELADAFMRRALEHRDTVMLGRTHGQYATPITFGLKMAVYAAETHRHLIRFHEIEPRVCVGQMSGATGTGAAFGPRSLEIQALVMEELGLGEEEAGTQIVQRDRHTEFICHLANIAASVEKFATEIRNLQRSELMEAAEAFDVKKQVGSSTMAHKKNPITCENICGLARIVRAFVTPTFENVPTWHERDLTNSSAERFIIGHACVLCDDILQNMAAVIRDLAIFPGNMKRNLDGAKGLIMAEAVMIALTKKSMGRQEAHEVVRQVSMKAMTTGNHLLDELKADRRVTALLTHDEIDEIMHAENYTGQSAEIVERVRQKIERERKELDA